MVMNERTMPAGRFKAECLAVLDEVEATGQAVVVTKRGRPVARVLPLEPPPDLRGSVAFLVDDDELVAPLEVNWDVGDEAAVPRRRGAGEDGPAPAASR